MWIAQGLVVGLNEAVEIQRFLPHIKNHVVMAKQVKSLAGDIIMWRSIGFCDLAEVPCVISDNPLGILAAAIDVHSEGEL